VPAWDDTARGWASTFAALLTAEDATVPSRHRLAEIRQVLLPKLISGELRVPPAPEVADTTDEFVHHLDAHEEPALA
jgi:hypothetical protein